jgi:hypothetical protein
MGISLADLYQWGAIRIDRRVSRLVNDGRRE